eukprot:838010-Alexandrium_andersonii.AAC.1
MSSKGTANDLADLGARFRHECIQRYLDSLKKRVPWVTFGPGEAPVGPLVLREIIPLGNVPVSYTHLRAHETSAHL